MHKPHCAWLICLWLTGCVGQTSSDEDDLRRRRVPDMAMSSQDLATVSPDLATPPGQSPPWTGILANDRAADWSHAGVPGGIPSRTNICANVLTSDTTAQIQSKIDGCPQDGVVQFPSGTWTLTGSIHSNKGVVLRGNGPTNTQINLTGGNVFLGTFGTGYLGGYASGLGSTNWTGGLTKGSTVLTLASTAGIKAGQRIILDQLNAPYVFTGGVENGVNGHCYPYNSCGRNDCTEYDHNNPDVVARCTQPPFLFEGGSDNRAQLELVEIQSIDGPTQITIKAPGVAFDHSAALAPQAFWWNTNGGNGPGSIKHAGIENLSINANHIDYAVSMPWCDECWVKNVAITNIARAAVLFAWGMHDEVRDSYVSASNTSGGPTQYGIEIEESTFTKVENNVFFGITANILPAGSYGLVAGYNYTRNTATGPQFASFEPHKAHNYLHLYEGNVVDSIGYDRSWGSSSHNTAFRNRVSGNSPNKNNYRIPMLLRSANQYLNLVGNVLGDTTFHTQYVCDLANQLHNDDRIIYDLGFTDGCGWGITSAYPYDNVTESSLMRWGNWDAVTYKANGSTDGVRWCTGTGAGNSACTTSETDGADPIFPGLPFPDRTLPASFYLTGKPSWFKGVSFPPIGPDVACTTNCIDNAANHANKIPAQLCYENTVKDSGGFLTAFDANACYY